MVRRWRLIGYSPILLYTPSSGSEAHRAERRELVGRVADSVAARGVAPQGAHAAMQPRLERRQARGGSQAAQRWKSRES
jgi:hypothetical protein